MIRFCNCGRLLGSLLLFLLDMLAADWLRGEQLKKKKPTPPATTNGASSGRESCFRLRPEAARGARSKARLREPQSVKLALPQGSVVVDTAFLFLGQPLLLPVVSEIF